MIYFEGIATFSKLQSVSFFAQLRSITREIEQYGIGIVFNTGHWDYNSFGKYPVAAFVCGKLHR